MSLSGTRMGDAVETALAGLDSSFTAAQVAQLKSAWEQICTAIVTEITTNAVVTVSVTGVQSGAGTAPGTGTIS